jgi:succinyl-CoA synthetase beta subunit
MNIHEYQAKAVLKEFGVPVSKGAVAFTPEEAVSAAQSLPGPIWVVKAQIHAGGRGKGRFKEADAGEKGGVRLAKSVAEVGQFAREMLGKTLVTIQTGPDGKRVNRLYIEDGSAIKRELYLSALVDRATSRVSFITSTEGGMDIEEVAHKTPEKIITLDIDPASGYSPFHGRKIAFALGLEGDQVKQCVKLIGNLYRAFTEKDIALLEINPLVKKLKPVLGLKNDATFPDGVLTPKCAEWAVDSCETFLHHFVSVSGIDPGFITDPNHARKRT